MDAVIYVRISKDDTHEAQGVGRQLADCRSLVERRGWNVVAEVVDNYVRAFKRRKPRPGWTEVTRLIETGDAQALVGDHPDRFLRDARDLEDLVDLVERTNVWVETCTAGDYDLRTPEGRLVARITASVAIKESEDKSRRSARLHAALAAEGRPSGGTRRFGFTTAMEPVPVEQEVVRRAAAMLLEGSTISEAVAMCNASGVPRVKTSAPWTPAALHQALVSGATAGLRVHRGEVVGPASWEPILDRVTRERVVALYAGRRSGGGYVHRLLTGLLECGTCSAALKGARGYRGAATYACAAGCVQIAGVPLEDLVVGQALAVLEALPAATPLEPERSADVDEAKAKLLDVALMFQRGEISKDEWLAMRPPLAAAVEEAEAAQQTGPGLRRPARRRGQTVADAWANDWTIGQRREALASVVERVVVPQIRSRVWDPERPRISWRA